MKVELLLNDYNGQVLPISEGIAETQANLKLVGQKGTTGGNSSQRGLLLLP
jgi:hypothetical protein